MIQKRRILRKPLSQKEKVVIVTKYLRGDKIKHIMQSEKISKTTLYRVLNSHTHGVKKITGGNSPHTLSKLVSPNDDDYFNKKLLELQSI